MVSESEIILIAQNGDLDAFNRLVLQYQDAVYSVCYRIMGEAESAADATQEAFINAYRRLASYRGGSFRAWLLTIATNACYDELRRRKRRPATGIDDLPGSDSQDGPALPSTDDTPEEVALQNELNQAIHECIQNLQDDQRLALVMFDLEGFSYQEIADMTQTQLGTVKSRLSRARVGVRRCLEAVRELLPNEFRLNSN